MTKTIKHSVLLVIAILTCALLLVGCADAPTDTDSDTQTQASSDTQQTGVGDGTTDPADTTGGSENNDDTDKVADWTEDGELKILTIGNSFSDDTMQYVYQIAQDAGVKKLKLGNLYIGGCSLDTHASNARSNAAAYEYRTNSSGTWSTVKSYRMGDAIKSENWDFISLQQASGASGRENTYGQLGYLIEYVRTLCPNAKLIWNMTWAYQQDSTHSSFPNYNSDQMTMYNAILSAVEKKIASRDDIHAISPTGTAIQNARTSYIGDRLTRDGYHLSYDMGRYTAALTFFYKLTGVSIENVTYAPEGVDESMRAIAIESAINAVKTPTSVTESSYKTEPLFDESKYTKLEISWTPLGYWYSTSAANHHKVVTGASNSKSFYATQMFTPETLPVGSVIVLAEGWRYRPEAWKSTGVQSSRPGLTSTERVTVTAEWWGDYTHRALNLAKTDGSSLASVSQSEIDAALTIYIPKS